MRKVTIEFEAGFEQGKSFGDCLNDLLDTYYSDEGAEAPSIFLYFFKLKLELVPCLCYNANKDTK